MNLDLAKRIAAEGSTPGRDELTDWMSLSRCRRGGGALPPGRGATEVVRASRGAHPRRRVADRVTRRAERALCRILGYHR
jgi:hypothetical protein